MSTRTCRCRGECGSGRCLGHLSGGAPCAARDDTFHLIDGSPVRIRNGLCLFCRSTRKRTRHHRQKRHERITATDGQTRSLFSLLAEGGFS